MLQCLLSKGNLSIWEIQLSAGRMHKPWRQTVREFLQIDHATPLTTTGPTPFEFLRKRKILTKLNTLPVSGKITPHKQVKNLWNEVNKRSKAYTDRGRGAKVPTFQANDAVHVQTPEHIYKGSWTDTQNLWRALRKSDQVLIFLAMVKNGMPQSCEISQRMP